MSINKRQLIIRILDKIYFKNIHQRVDSFNKVIQEFGDFMDSLTREMSTDIEKSNKESMIREKRNKENLDKIWGKRD